MAKKVQIALVLLNRQFVRSWVSSGLLEHLRDSGLFDVHVFGNRETLSSIKSEIPGESVVELQAKKSKWVSRLILADLVACRDRSATFRFRITRMFFPETRFFCSNQGFFFSVFWFLRNLKWSIGKSFENRRAFIYFLPLARRIVFSRYQKSKAEECLPSGVHFYGMDWIIIPAASSSSLLTDIVKFARTAQIKTLVAMDNWDNLTSKSTFPLRPSLMTVMGKKDVQYAVSIHQFDPRRVAPIGLPRFDIYRMQDRANLVQIDEDPPVILYCGFSLAHSEMRVIDYLAWHLDDTRGLGKARIIYRPHPGALPRFDDYKFTNPRIMVHEFGDLSQTELPKTDRAFIDQIRNVSVVVGGPTTLMLEAMFLRKPCVLDLTRDDYHRTTAGIAAQRYTHLQDMTAIPELRRGDTIEKLCAEVSTVLDLGLREVDYSISDLFDSAGTTYRSELVNLLLQNSHKEAIDFD